MVSPDKVLVCRECGRQFAFPSGEQEFYAQRGYSEPGRCPECRRRRRLVGARGCCSQCGAVIAEGKAVYCSRCLDAARLEVEFKIRAEESLRAEQWREETLVQLLREIEIEGGDKGAYDAVVAGVEELSSYAEELRVHLEALRLREQELAAALEHREHHIVELTGKLADAEGQKKDLALRLELAELKLQNKELAAYGQVIPLLEKTLLGLENRIAELERRQRNSLSGLLERLRRRLYLEGSQSVHGSQLVNQTGRGDTNKIVK